jgi:hypothetical protein
MDKANKLEGLEFSIPANNQKIIEIYNKLRSEQIIVNKDYQRKLVWKKSHKLDFIDTILKNYPFPEIYLAPGNLDQEKLILVDEIVDGQQRLTTIRNYIEGVDIFGMSNGLSIKKFNELSPEEKIQFLNYEISVRYLKNVTPDQVREIFQRINKTDYALNPTERINAQWGDSEFVCLAKQIVEHSFKSDSVVFVMDTKTRNEFLEFFHGDSEDDESVFSGNDLSRMLALQFIMTLIATMDSGEYFNRNDRLEFYIVNYNESFNQALEITERLYSVVKFIKQMNLGRYSRWFKKANLFTLIIELDKKNLTNIDISKLSTILELFDHRATVDELLGIDDEKDKLNADEVKYLSLAREAVNQKSSRIYRGDFVGKLIDSCKIN